MSIEHDTPAATDPVGGDDTARSTDTDAAAGTAAVTAEVADAGNGSPTGTARGTFRVIALDRLVPSPDNVRTLRPKKDPADRQLVESIRAHGLLENLVVVACEDAPDERFEVVAGERRRLALRALVDEGGDVPPTTPVPCLVVSREDAISTSLAENEVRRDMHPADRHAAFRRLVEAGASEADVARRYGLPKAEVRRLLRLSALHPTLLALFAEDRLSFDAALAYAATADTGLQLAVHESLGARADAPTWRIRDAIRTARVASNGAVARFVGTAYRKAGGASEADLFDGGKWWTDLALVARLVDERLAREAAKVEGWAWVEACRPEDAHPHRYGRLTWSVVDIPDALADELGRSRTRLAALEAMPFADLTAEEYDESDALADAIETMERTVETEHSRWSDEDRRFAGCLVTFDRHDGALVVHEGLQTEEDRRRQRAAAGEDVERGTDDAASAPAGGDVAPSGAFARDLGLYRRHAIRATLAGNPTVAGLLRDWHLCRTAFERYRYLAPVLSWQGTIVCDETSREDIESTPAGVALGRLVERAATLWPSGGTPAESYAAFAALSRARRETLVAVAVALQLEGGLVAGADDDVPAAALDALDVNFAAAWRPTGTNCFSRMTRVQLVALGVEWYGEGFAAETAKATKRSIVERFERLFHGPEDALSEAERAIRERWLPDALRSTDDD